MFASTTRSPLFQPPSPPPLLAPPPSLLDSFQTPLSPPPQPPSYRSPAFRCLPWPITEFMSADQYFPQSEIDTLLADFTAALRDNHHRPDFLFTRLSGAIRDVYLPHIAAALAQVARADLFTAGLQAQLAISRAEVDRQLQCSAHLERTIDRLEDDVHRNVTRLDMERARWEAQLREERSLFSDERAKREAQLKEERGLFADERAKREAQLKEERGLFADERAKREAQLKEERGLFADERAKREAQLKEERGLFADERAKWEAQLKEERGLFTDERARSEIELTRIIGDRDHMREECHNLSEQYKYWQNQYRTALADASRERASHHIPSSTTRAQMWKEIKSQNGSLHHLNEPLNILISSPEKFDYTAIYELETKIYQGEPDMYPDLVDFMNTYFHREMTAEHPGVEVIDTHARYYLNGLAPDLTLSVGGVQVADPASVYLVMEVKAHDQLGTDENLGQLLDYLVALQNSQPNRRRFAAILTNFKSNIIVEMDVTDNATFITQYAPVGLLTAMCYIDQVSLVDGAQRPLERGFSINLGVLVRRLGRPTNSIVGEFHINPSGSAARYYIQPATNTTRSAGCRTMAVKRSRAQSSYKYSELRVLKLIASDAPPDICPFFPQIIYDSPGEFGTTPVGRPLLLDQLPAAGIMRQILKDILSALSWLHSLPEPLVHRDVRCDNVLMSTNGRGILIDFDNVAMVGTPTAYYGGYICCPRELIGRLELGTLYVPRPEHDYEAFLLFANTLAFPGRIRGDLKRIQWKHVAEESPESLLLEAFWVDIQGSEVWAPYLAAAGNADLVKLGEMCAAFVYL